MSTVDDLFDVFDQLSKALKAKGVPFEVIDGPAQQPLAIGGSRVQLLSDEELGDQFLPPRGAHRNPRMYAILAEGGIARIHASSTKEGARRRDHHRVARLVAKQIYAELVKIIGAANTVWRPVRAGVVLDPTTPDGWSGVVYEFRFQVEFGVFDVTWTGKAAAEAAPMVATTTHVTGSASGDLPSASTRIS